MSKINRISGWGNYPSFFGRTVRPKTIEEVRHKVKDLSKTLIARGGKTSYGDASINHKGLNIEMNYFNKFISFSDSDGILHCQAGVNLLDIIERYHDKGWFLNITPGTPNATVGGCIACDCHGKNWEAGAFSNFLIGFSLLLSSGDLLWCYESSEPDLFKATIGGMGLTGVIIDAKIKLKKVKTSFMEVSRIKVHSLEELFDQQKQAMKTHEYLFTWIDSQKKGENIGRGIMQVANHSDEGKRVYIKQKQFSVPLLPNFAVNRYSVKAFNFSYYHFRKRRVSDRQYFLNFFYPLNSFRKWNRVYGTKGFIEYQVVIPYLNAYKIINKILYSVTKSGLGSTIAAIKPLSKSKGLFSFPINGITLAIDFAFDTKVLELLNYLDDILIEVGGKVYLGKDSRLSSKVFHKMYYDEIQNWNEIKSNYQLSSCFNSDMLNRLRI